MVFGTAMGRAQAGRFRTTRRHDVTRLLSTVAKPWGAGSKGGLEVFAGDVKKSAGVPPTRFLVIATNQVNPLYCIKYGQSHRSPRPIIRLCGQPRPSAVPLPASLGSTPRASRVDRPALDVHLHLHLRPLFFFMPATIAVFVVLSRPMAGP